MKNDMPDGIKQAMEQVTALAANAQTRKTQEAGNNIAKGNSATVGVAIDYTADSGNHYFGVLEFRRPSAWDYALMGADKSNIIARVGIKPLILVNPQGTPYESLAHVDFTVMQTITAIATLKHLFVSGPSWAAELADNQDADLLLHVYDEFDKELYSFRSADAELSGGGSETTGDTANVASEEALRGLADGEGRRDTAPE